MDLYTLMKNRRSTRVFSHKPVSEKKLHAILTAGQYAPSGADQKPYVCIVVDDPDIKQQIKQYSEDIDKKHYATAPDWFKQWMKRKNVSLDKTFLIDAPFLVIVAGETDKPYWLESTWISIAYILLAAENEGLATLTYTPAKTDFLYDILDLPRSLQPVVILPIGYPKKL